MLRHHILVGACAAQPAHLPSIRSCLLRVEYVVARRQWLETMHMNTGTFGEYSRSKTARITIKYCYGDGILGPVSFKRLSLLHPPAPSFYPRVSCLLHSPGLARVVSRLSFNALKFAFSLALIALLLTGPQLGQYLALLLSLCKVCLPSPLLN